ncbi:MAG: hypothetical protein ABIR37_02785 [Candidatus Saccharimonadales bacterium]
MVPTKPRLTSAEDLKKLRFAELDAAYSQQLKALSDMMRTTTRRSLRKLKSHL